MKKLTLVLFGLLMSLCISAQAQQFKVLLFTKTAGFHHESINEGVTAMRQMAKFHHFALDWHEDASVFTDQRLQQYQAIIFMNTTGDILNTEQEGAMMRFIQSGKGFVGIHSASDTEYDWDWYTNMIGHMFHIHPVIQTGELLVLDRKFPGVERMPDRFLWTEEWYEFDVSRNKGLNYILAVDEKSYDPNVRWGEKVGKGMGKFHPIAWYHNYDGGRAFYTALGHMGSTYDDALFQEHVYGGIYWAATGKGLKKK